jgi:outer membrane protein insertion porin family
MPLSHPPPANGRPITWLSSAVKRPGIFAAILLWTLPSFAQTPPEAPPAEIAPGPLGTGPQRPTPSEAEAARDATILEIRVDGNHRVATEDVTAYLRERVGDPFSPERLTQDVRDLWKSGYFNDISVELTRTDEGVRVRFMLQERASILDIEFKGNEEIDADDLKEGIPLKASTILSQATLSSSVQKIRDMYAEKGYFLAEVTDDVTLNDQGEARVKFTIRENSEVTVKRVTFIGNQFLSDDELRAIMFTGNPGFFGLGSGGPFRQDAFERDIAMLSALYYDRGFLQVAVSTPRVMLTPDRSGIEVAVTLEEGPRFRIRGLRVYEKGPSGGEIEPLEGRRNLRMMVRAESGDYFNRAELVEDIQKIRALYRNNGYASVEASPDTQLDVNSHEVDVAVPVVRGPLVHYERIEFRGNSKTRDKVLRRELEIVEGETFDESKIEASKRRITALGYFERVDVTMEQGSRPDTMNVYFEVAERPTGTFQIGAGFSSLEKFIATAQIQQANFFGNGQSLALQLQVSQVRQMANLRLFEPYFLDSPFNASVELYDQYRQYTDFTQSSLGGNLTFGYPLITPTLNASITYTLENTEVSTDTSSNFFGSSTGLSVFRQLPLANLFNDGITSSLRPALTFDSRDNRLFPTSGIYLRASTELAATYFGSHTEFLRHHLTGRFYYPLLTGVVLKLNTETEHVTSPGQQGVPIYARSYLGGIFDVRGFPYRSIGPRIPLTSSTDPNSQPLRNGASIGGNLSYFQNLELEFDILTSVGIKGVVFTDAGNAWNLEQNYCDSTLAFYPETSACFNGFDSLKHLRTSWGFGLRWFSPLGPLRFEWGFPFSPLPYEDSSAFEFTIGNFF